MPTQEQIIEKKLMTKINKSINKYKMLEENDKILVGLSGGKDSLVLLKSLAWIAKRSQIDFSVSAIYIDILNIPYNANIEYLASFSKENNIEFIHERISDDIDLANSKKNPCFLCSWDRRKHLFEIAKQKGFNKLALGHHMNDVVETLLMNMMYQANISALPPTLEMFDGQISIIRPLIETKEDLIIKYAEIQNFKPMIKNCPYEKISSREFVRKILKTMDEEYDRSVNNIFYAMSNIDKAYLP